MPRNLQITDVDRFVAHLAATESVIISGYSGNIPFNLSVAVDPQTNLVLASHNGPMSYSYETKELRLRLSVFANGTINFVRILDSSGTLMAQVTNADFSGTPAVIGRTIRFIVPDVRFTLIQTEE